MIEELNLSGTFIQHHSKINSGPFIQHFDRNWLLITKWLPITDF
jgi:hypothetical protein